MLLLGWTVTRGGGVREQTDTVSGYKEENGTVAISRDVIGKRTELLQRAHLPPLREVKHAKLAGNLFTLGERRYECSDGKACVEL